MEIQGTINKYQLDDNALQIAEIERTTKDETKNKTKEKKHHTTKLLTERVSIQSNTGYLLQQTRILNQLYAEFAGKCTPFKIEVSKPHSHSMIISASNKSHITKIRQYIIKHIQNKILSIKCGDKKAAVIGAGGLNFKMIKDECHLNQMWEDDVISGLIHIYDRNLRLAYKAMDRIQNILDRTSILSLPIGQYGLLIVDKAYWLDFIREHSNAFIVGLDMKPSELHKRKLKQIEDLNTRNLSEQENANLVRDLIENTMKSRLLISGDSEEITMNATQMLYEFLKDTEEIEIEKKQFGHVLGKYKRTINAIINEVETKFIDDGEYKKYFQSEQIEENENDDPFWLEGLRFSIFPTDEVYGFCSIWIHAPPFMRNALKYYINSVILQRRTFRFTNATNFWIQLLLEYKMECYIIWQQIEKLFGVKCKLVKTQKDIKLDENDEKYKRIYDGDTYLLLESMDRNNKLNVPGIRKYLDDLAENSTKMGLGAYNNLFQRDLLQFWQNMANECGVSIMFNDENNEILIIGLSENVKSYQDKLLKVIKKIKVREDQDMQETIDKQYLVTINNGL